MTGHPNHTVTLEDRHAVYLLLRGLNAWIPTPKASRIDGSAAGFAHTDRYESCPDCLANDRVRPTCETCRGAGEIPVQGRDPYERPSTTSFWGDEQQRRRDHAKARDAAIARIERDWGPDAGAEAADPLTVAVDRADRHYRRGSFAQLRRALNTVDAEAPRRVRALIRLVVNGEEDVVVVPPWTRDWLDETVDWVAQLMPRPIMLPAELQRDIDAWKHALQHGKTPQHQAARAERNADIVRLAGEPHCWSLRRIGRVYGLSPEGVRRILVDAGARAAVATGPAA